MFGMLLSAALSALGVGVIVWCTGMPEPGTFGIGVEDEMSHLLLANTFAEGRLTNQPHTLWRHFETQYVISQPTYTSKYPPALPALFALGVVLADAPFLGIWTGLAVMCAAVTWMLYAWLPPRWALAGGVLFAIHMGIDSMWTYYFSGGGIPTVTGAALLVGAMRRVMKTMRVRDSVIAGFGLLILSFGRPYEGMILSLPVLAIVASWLKADRRPWGHKCRRVILPVGAMLLVTAALNGIYNHAVTGSAFQLPYQRYVLEYNEVPNIMLAKPGSPPDTPHQVFRAKWQAEYDYYQYQRSVRGLLLATYWKLKEYSWFYIGPILAVPFLAGLTLVFRRSWELFAAITSALVVGAVCLNFAMQVHYPAPAAPLLLYLIVQGCRRISHVVGRHAFAKVMSVVVLATLAFTVVNTVGHARQRDNPPVWVRQRLEVRDYLLGIPGNDLVLVTYETGFKPHMDIIFNEPRIDDAPIVWTRSMSDAENAKLLEYFQDRRVWTLHLSAEPTEIILPTPMK